MFAAVKKGHFDAAHRLPGVEICQNLHGHRFEVEVRVASDRLNGWGMVIDFRDLTKCWQKYDHTYLNDVLSMPTAENLAQEIYWEITKLLSSGQRVSYVRVWESPDAYAEVS